MSATGDQDRIDEQAALWHARLDAPDMDWDGLAQWLDASPAHRAAYDEVASLDAEIGDRRAAIAAAMPANDPGLDPGCPLPSTPPPRGRLWWKAGGGLAVAAGIAAVVLPQLPFFATPGRVVYRTGPAETRAVTLADGSTMLMGRNSSISVVDGDAPRIDVAGGGAYFDIRHDPARELLVTAGGYEVRDIGTRFDLSRSDRHLAVAVADGQVRVAPAGADGTIVAAGRRIDVDMAGGDAVLRPIAIAGVGAWQRDRLIYDDSPLALVATDLSRYAGRAVSVDPAIADMRLSGVLMIGDGTRLVGQIEALLPVRAQAEGDHIRLVPAR